MPSHPALPTSEASQVARRPLARRVLRGLGILLATLLVLGTAGVAFAWFKLDSNISEQDVSDLLGDERPQKVVQGEGEQEPLNILLIGSDTREGRNRKYDNKTIGARSDTTILLHLAADRQSAIAVSIPRDTIIDIPQCQKADGTTTRPVTNRFNDAYTRGGTACTIRTVEALTRVHIDHYVVVDFTGFAKMVNALGGVEICLPERVDDNDSKLHLDAGRHLVKGRTALAYVRTRKALGNGSDIERIDRQQAFLSSVVNRVKSTGVLRADRLVRFLDAATKSITTDPGLGSLNELRKLAQSVRDIDPGDISFVTAPNKPNPANLNTVVLKQPAAEKLWSVLRYDLPLPNQQQPRKPGSPSPSASAKPLKTTPEDIRVRVLNGAGVAGAAGTLAEKLKVAGFNVLEVGDANRSDYAVTEIRHSPTYDESARTLGAALVGAKVIADPAAAGSATLTVIVGADSPQVAPIEVEGSAASPAEPTISARKATQDICS